MRFLISFSVALLGIIFSSFSWAQVPVSATLVNDFEVVQLDSPLSATRPGGDIALSLEAWGDEFRFVLRDNEQLLQHLPSSRRSAIGTRGDRFLIGSLEGMPDSWVRMNWIDGQFSGAFYDGNTLYVIDTPQGFVMPNGRAVDASATLLMRFSDLQLDGLFDHGGVSTGQSSPPVQNYQDYVADLRAFVQAEGVSLLNMPVTLIADTFFEDDLGSNAESTAIGRLNSVDGIFSNQLGVGIVLWHYEQLSDNGPLTSTDANELLTAQFRSYMTNGAGSNLPFQGLAHLFTGRDLDGSTAGIAYIGALCSRNFGFGVDQNLSSNTTSFLVFAHELGHNFNAEHVDEGIMRPSVGGTQEFSQESLDVMSAAVASANCLVEVSSEIFKDGFE